MIVAALILIPFIFGLISLFASKYAKYTSLVGALAFATISLGMVYTDLSTTATLNCNVPWVPSLGISLIFNIDGINAILLLLTAVITPLIIISSFSGREYSDNANFYALISFMQCALAGVFTANDLFCFYIFWELALIPIYFICAIWGGENRIQVTFKFFIYTIFGSLFMLAGIITLYLQTPAPHSFDWNVLNTLDSVDDLTEIFIFICFSLGFAIKMPIFPLHTWQPTTYAVSPTPGTMLLSGIMLKMGIWGFIHWVLPITPQSFIAWQNIFITISVTGIVYASVIAIMQTDYKKLVAYSSIAHVGMIAAGLFTTNIEGVQGAVIQMFSHGVNVVGLFFVLEIIHRRTGTYTIAHLGGIAHKAPFLSVCFVIIMLGTVALPLTNGFVGEFLLFTSLFKYQPVLCTTAGVSVILGAVYMLRMYKSIMLGSTNDITQNFTDITFEEKVVLVPICLIIIAMGVYPNMILSISEPYSYDIVNFIKDNRTDILTYINTK
ncbi:MAG: NADH-quinone oxidoreductase subunit M [Cytophagales bacterium]|nr:NADH-quinone oxidoreductase subunit M [Cytophagales bacterium]